MIILEAIFDLVVCGWLEKNILGWVHEAIEYIIIL